MGEPMKPCPFCGEAMLPHGTDSSTGTEVVDFVMCHKCGVGFSNQRLTCPDCQAGLSENPRESWNRRAMPPAVAKAMQRVEAELKVVKWGPENVTSVYLAVVELIAALKGAYE
jgi:hypothetical protein